MDSEAHASSEFEPPRRRSLDDDSDEGSLKRGLFIVIPLVTIAGAVLALAMFGLRDKGIYALGLDELLDARERYEGRAVRAEGVLVSGTLVKRDQPCEYRFDIERGSAKIGVRYPQCIVPDTFRDVEGTEVQVTVEGKLTGEHFEATSVIAKCPSKYEMEKQQASGEAKPHGAVAPLPTL